MAAVTFDVWHTLIALSPADGDAYYRAQVHLAVEALRSAERLPGAPDLADEELARTFEQILAGGVADAGRGHSVTPQQQILRAGQATGRAVRPEAFLEPLDRVVTRLPFKPAPGAAGVLERLRGDGYRIGIVGNTVGETGASLLVALRSMHLAQYVETFVFSDEQPWAKPAPEIFWEALRRLGESPADAVHVGDSWFDIEGARRAGLRGSILFTGLQDYGERYRALNLPASPPRPPADHVAGDMNEVLSLVHELLPLPRGMGAPDRS